LDPDPDLDPSSRDGSEDPDPQKKKKITNPENRWQTLVFYQLCGARGGKKIHNNAQTLQIENNWKSKYM
jgi:hypothetical protein